MNYYKIYEDLIDRAHHRNLNDSYKEKHHIIPDFMFLQRNRKGPSGHVFGNSNDSCNLIYLTAREHLVAHLLLSKILKNTRYFYSANSALVFFAKVASNHPRQNAYRLTSWEYEKCRKSGLLGISLSRQGKMPCVDEFGVSVGSWATDHPNVLLGKWTHHSKGFVFVKNLDGKKLKVTKAEYNENRSKYVLTTGFRDCAGNKNPNFKEISSQMKSEYIDELIKVIMVCTTGNYLKKVDVVNTLRKISKAWGFKKISEAFINSKFEGFDNLAKLVSAKYNKKVTMLGKRKPPIIRTLYQNNNFNWINNGVVNAQLKRGTAMPDGFRMGRML